MSVQTMLAGFEGEVPVRRPLISTDLIVQETVDPEIIVPRFDEIAQSKSLVLDGKHRCVVASQSSALTAQHRLRCL